MKLIKDLLVFHVQTTGPDVEKDHIIQLAAVLLDKNSLLEKDYFNSYVKVSFLDTTIANHAKDLGTSFEIIKKSPKINEVIKQFVDKFAFEPLLATNSIPNYLFLKQAFKKNLTDFNYDNHLLDIWSLGYIYVLHYGLKKIPTLTTLATHFNLKVTNQNDGLEKARLSASVLRKIING